MENTQGWFERILNSIDDLILVKGEKSKILWANNSFLNYYGMSREEMHSLVDGKHSDPDNTLQYVKDDEKVFSTQKKLDIPSEPVTNKDGAVHYFHTIKTPIFENDKMIQSVGVSRKIESTKEIDVSFVEQNNKKDYIRFQRNLMKSLNLPVVFMDASERIVFVTEAFSSIFGLETSHFNDKNFDYIFSQTGLKADQFKSGKLEINSVNIELNSKVATGDLTIIPWFFTENEVGGQFILFKDKTEEIKLSEKLKTAVKKNITADKLRSLSEISAGVGHEINNPLSIVLGCIEKIELSKEYDTISPSLNKDLQRIKHNSERISQIVNSLRALSRDSSNDPTQSSSVCSVIEEAMTVTHERFKRHEIKFLHECDDSIKIKLRTGEITQVFINLINNAIDEIKDLKDPWIRIKSYLKENHCLIEFTDSGNGISEAIVPRIFDPFFTTKDVGEGTGLGLGICHDIISNHGGEMIYDDTKENTTFKIRMPI